MLTLPTEGWEILVSKISKENKPFFLYTYPKHLLEILYIRSQNFLRSKDRIAPLNFSLHSRKCLGLFSGLFPISIYAWGDSLERNSPSSESARPRWDLECCWDGYEYIYIYIRYTMGKKTLLLIRGGGEGEDEVVKTCNLMLTNSYTPTHQESRAEQLNHPGRSLLACLLACFQARF